MIFRDGRRKRGGRDCDEALVQRRGQDSLFSVHQYSIDHLDRCIVSSSFEEGESFRCHRSSAVLLMSGS